jgi:hypothetical protein
VRSTAVVEVKIAAEGGAGFGHVVVGAQIDLLVFDAASEALDKHVVAPSPFGTGNIHVLERDARVEDFA